MGRATGSLIAAVVLGLGVAAGAGAATELGQLQAPGQLEGCDGMLNVVQRSAGPGAAYEVPAAGGVLTSWRYRGGPVTSGGRLLVWRPAAGGANRHTLVARSRFEAFAADAVIGFAARIPVEGGERLGLRTLGFAGCVSEPVHGLGDVAVAEGTTAPDAAPGQTRDLSDEVGVGRRVNVAATLEPDADADGFGDESQDVAPVLTLDDKVKAKRSGFPVTVACGPVSCDAELSGTAVARGGRGSKKKRGTAARKKRKTKSFELVPTTVSVGAGSGAATNLKLKRAKKSTRKLRKLLKRRRFRKRSKLNLSVSATNALGAAGSAETAAKLRR